MPTTIESSAPYQNALDRTVPSQWQPQLRADLTELQVYRAADPSTKEVMSVKKAAKIARMAYARASRTDDKHAVMDAAIDAHQPQLPLHLWRSRRSRAEWLKKQMGEGAPHWRTIDTYLNTLHI